MHFGLNIAVISFCVFTGNDGVYIDKGFPYNVGPLKVGELTISQTEQKSPLHAKAFYPLEPGEYPVVYFVGGLNGKVLVEFYEEFLLQVASHGFVVLGVDSEFPVYDDFMDIPPLQLKNAVDKFIEELKWLQKYMSNRTECTLLWDRLGLLCHSAGCDSTLLMIKNNSTIYKSTIFLEPASYNVRDDVNVKLPALMYGTELSEEGLHKCAIPGHDFNRFYDIWSCPRIVMNVADFGHCDILDPTPWKACHDVHYCLTTKNSTRLGEYRQFVQGVVASFFITTLQGGSDMSYVVNKTNIPLPLKELKFDLVCSS